MISVISPVSGNVTPLDEVPDPVFSARMLGDGVAVLPADKKLADSIAPLSASLADRLHAYSSRPSLVISPIDGRLTRVMHHAFVVTNPQISVMVHLGIDTGSLARKRFDILAWEGMDVTAGQSVIRWEIGAVIGAGLLPMTSVVVLDSSEGMVHPQVEGRIEAGQTLFTYGVA